MASADACQSGGGEGREEIEVSLLARLPNELLEEILDYIESDSRARAICRLRRCEKTLHHRLEPFLLGDEEAMKWACEQGLVDLIDRCRLYGAALNSVQVTLNPFRNPHWKPRARPIVPTLYLAIKHGSLASFQHLLSLGAVIELYKVLDYKEVRKRKWSDIRYIESSTAEALVQSLCKPDRKEHAAMKPSMLRELLHSGAIASLDRPWVDRMLLFMLQSEVYKNDVIEFTRLLLEAGADINYTYEQHAGRSMCPLSAALLNQPPAVWKYLVDHGANINGSTEPVPLPDFLPSHPFHKPLIAAVVADLAAAPSTALTATRFCIERGAHVNCPIDTYDHFWTKSRRGGHTRPRTIKALDMFSPAAPVWTAPDLGPTALAGLKLLLDHSAQMRDKIRYDPPLPKEVHIRHRYKFGEVRYPLRLFSEAASRFESRPLCSPSQAEALLLVIRHSERSYIHPQTLALFHVPNAPCVDENKAGCQLEIFEIWDQILAETLSSFERSCSTPFRKEHLDKELRSYILALTGEERIGWRIYHDHPYYLSPKDPFIGALARATVRKFVAAGANVNCTPRRWSGHAPEADRRCSSSGPTTFFEFLVTGTKARNYDAKTASATPWRTTSWRSYSRKSFTEDRVQFLRFLAEEFGAVVDVPWFDAWSRLEGYRVCPIVVAGNEGESRDLAREIAEIVDVGKRKNIMGEQAQVQGAEERSIIEQFHSPLPDHTTTRRI